MGWDDFLGGGSSGGGTFGNILGGLGTAATIYGMYQQNQQAENAADAAQSTADRNFAEQQRQFNATLAFKQATAGGGGGGGGGGNAAALKAQIQAAHSKALDGAYNSLIKAVSDGRAGEANILSGLIDKVQRAYTAA